MIRLKSNRDFSAATTVLVVFMSIYWMTLNWLLLQQLRQQYQGQSQHYQDQQQQQHHGHLGRVSNLASSTPVPIDMAKAYD